MRNKNYHTVGTVSKSNSKIVETEKKSIPQIHTYDLSPNLVCIISVVPELYIVHLLTKIISLHSVILLGIGFTLRNTFT
jgi:hypothetical protein